MFVRRFMSLLLLAMLMTLPVRHAAAADAVDCADSASDACYFSFRPAGSDGRFHYYASRAPAAAQPLRAPVAALIAIHGHSRDANRTFDAALLAVRRAGALNRILVVAPVFQVDADLDRKCHTAGVPTAQKGDLVWTCRSWMEGGPADNGRSLTSFAAMDALVAEVARQWPGLRSITIAGFSAGAQMVQHYIGFAATAPAGGPAIRYVVADPGTWLYFDPVRPQPMYDGVAVDWSQCSGGSDFLGGCSLAFKTMGIACPAVDRWKYGAENLPVRFRRSAAQARARYAEADISYLEGELDSGAASGTAYRVLDKSCAAQAQGSYRLQRGLAYALYDRTLLAPVKRRQVVVVSGCAHAVTCVFPSEAARAALLGSIR